MRKFELKKIILGGVFAPDHIFIGGCPLTGKGITCQIKDFSQDQLAAWWAMDATSAGKYVSVLEVPEEQENTTLKTRKPSKLKANARKATNRKKKTET